MKASRTSLLYAGPASRALDEHIVRALGIAGRELMQRAGAAAYAELGRRWPNARNLTVVCGSGNNGGDGFVVAGLAAKAGLAVTVWLVGARARIGGDAAHFLAALDGSAVHFGGAEACATADVIVDALLGTGAERAVEGDYAEAIRAINDVVAPVLSLDLPSGLHAGRGVALGTAVLATATVTFIALKPGLLTADGPAYCGALVLADLDLPNSVHQGASATAITQSYAEIRSYFGPRKRTAHKGDFGHVLVIGGAPGYGGAARLAAEAAARVGAGLVSVASHPAQARGLNAGRPELMCHGVSNAAELRALATRASVIAVGPGLGQSDWSRTLFATARELSLPMVVDADALNLLAEDPDQCATRILTPHPGEAGRLAGIATKSVQVDRLAIARQLAEVYGGVIVLKGAGTIVQSAGRQELPTIIRGGNPGMASGGMGDVLTGVIAGLLAQGWSLSEAAVAGACLHAEAADRAAQDGERGLLASDLMVHLRSLVNPATDE